MNSWPCCPGRHLTCICEQFALLSLQASFTSSHAFLRCCSRSCDCRSITHTTCRQPRERTRASAMTSLGPVQTRSGIKGSGTDVRHGHTWTGFTALRVCRPRHRTPPAHRKPPRQPTCQPAIHTTGSARGRPVFTRRWEAAADTDTAPRPVSWPPTECTAPRRGTCHRLGRQSPESDPPAPASTNRRDAGPILRTAVRR